VEVAVRVATVAEQLFFTTVRIEGCTVDGAVSSGTGFFFTIRNGQKELPVIVTNKHVVESMHEASIFFVKGENGGPALGEVFPVSFSNEQWSKMWHGHPNPDIDITVFPVRPLMELMKEQGMNVFSRAIEPIHIPTEEQVQELDALEPVVFIGYPNGIWDSKNKIPIARQGVTATPIQVDFEGTPRFLIDASVFGGSSGSPVFAIRDGSFPTNDGGISIGSRRYFVGVVAAVFTRKTFNRVVPLPIPTSKDLAVQQIDMIDIGIVFKAQTVVDTIQDFIISENIEL
jgi:hypothetical protein